MLVRDIGLLALFCCDGQVGVRLMMTQAEWGKKKKKAKSWKVAVLVAMWRGAGRRGPAQASAWPSASRREFSRRPA